MADFLDGSAVERHSADLLRGPRLDGPGCAAGAIMTGREAGCKGDRGRAGARARQLSLDKRGSHG
jgi:hypothetical protein